MAGSETSHPNLDEPVFVAGHNGMVGSAIVRRLKAGGYRNLLLRSRKELDLTEQDQVRRFFEREKPAVVYLAAARVGGIYANNTFPAEFIYQNVAIFMHVVEAAYHNQCRRLWLIFIGR